MTQSGAAEALRDFFDAHRSIFVLTGAGLSHGSGIPTYRDHDARWQRSAPITHQAFRSSEAARKRYWARSMAGWPLMGRARPNAAHRALATLQQSGRIGSLTTQNVDGLHQRAGSDDVIELHGNVGDVRCLDCEARLSRADVQQTLIAMNPDFVEHAGPVVPMVPMVPMAPMVAMVPVVPMVPMVPMVHMAQMAQMAPDGDADIALATDEFAVPPCPWCGGTLKPDVVFFGDNVPRDRVERAFAALDVADAVLVVGSSLMVWSGFRFCDRAAAKGMPIASVNQGRTRADHLFALKVEDDCATVLPALVERLLRPALVERL